MTARWGATAAVVGAGIAGLSAAVALQRHFDRVVVFERDVLPDGPEQRPSIPQGRHVHTLLAGGLAAMERLLPGITDALVAAGAVRLQVDLDLRVERVPFDPFPSIDAGFTSYALSRPLLESCLRDRVRALPGVSIEAGCTVQQLLADTATQSARGVRYTRDGGSPLDLACDLVADCSARGELTFGLLRELGMPEPHVTSVGIEILYSTAIFEKPRDANPSWKVVVTLPDAPRSSAGALLAPLESDRWMLSLGGRHDEQPGVGAAFDAFLGALRTPTIARAIEGAKRLSEATRFGLRESRRRHFEQLSIRPRRLVTLGDAVCRFNPIYGQGMSVAAQQCVALAQLLEAPAPASDPWVSLGDAMAIAANAALEGAWHMSATPDFIYPQTTGERPPDLEFRLKRSSAIQQLAASDADVHRAMLRVGHLLDPPATLYTPELKERMKPFLT